MVPSGPQNPVGGTQSIPATLLRSNSAILGGAQAGSMPSQQPFSSLISPRTQFNDNASSSNNNGVGFLGNISNVSSLLGHSFGNGGPVSGSARSTPSINLQERGGGAGDMLGNSEMDSLSFASSTGINQGHHFQNPSGNQLECMQNFQRQFSLPHNQQQAQLRGGLGSIGSMAPVKLEPQLSHSDKSGQALQSIGAVKLESQQLQSIRGLGPVKLERQHSDSSLFLQQQQQQQQLQMMQLPRPTSQAGVAQISLLQQQRLLQLQQQQQQQILKNLPQQRSQLHQQLQQVPVRPQVKPTLYEPGMCARRLTHFMYQQQHRPEDNNIDFWRKFVAEFFASNAKKRWCVSLYGSGRQTTGVFPQDAWHCEICNRKPGRGFETTVEVLPRLLQIKYASGTLEELLYVDMPREYQNASGQIVLDYAKAIQESVFEQLRVVREGQLRIVFSSDLKICSWEFCARRHEELIPRRLLIPQVSQLGTVVQKYQNGAQNTSSTLSTHDLQNTCSSFVASARQLAKALEVPLVNDLGYTKRYVRCLQISEVVNCMKDLIDYSRETGTGPMDSLINFPRRNTASTGQQQGQQTEEKPSIDQSSNHNEHSSTHAAGVQLSSTGNGILHNNSLNNLASSCTTSIGGLHQNSMSRQENQMSSVNGPFGGGNAVQIASASSSNSLPPSQPNGSSPFPSPTPSTSNHNSTQLSSAHSPANVSALQQQSMQPHEGELTETQSSVQQMLQEMIMTSQINGVDNMGNELKVINSMTPGLNGITSNSGAGGMGFGSMGMIGTSSGAVGLRSTMANNSMGMNAMGMNTRVGMNHMLQNLAAMGHQQQDIGNRFMGDLAQVNFNNLQLDWKTSP